MLPILFNLTHFIEGLFQLSLLDCIVERMRHLAEMFVPDPSTFSSIEMVAWTSAFCFTLTLTLMLWCYLHPPHEMVLMLDVTFMAADIERLRSSKKTLRKVSLKGFEDYDEADLLPLFQELAELPGLTSLTVDLLLPVSGLNCLLEGAKQLKELSLFFKLKGGKEDMLTLGNLIREHSSLEKVTINFCSYDQYDGYTSADSDKDLDPFIYALSELPTLRVLSIHNLQTSPACFTMLLRSKYIQTLKLSCIPPLSSDQVSLLLCNNTLESLSAPLQIGTEDVWGNLVRQSSTLNTLSLILESAPCTAKENPMNDVFLPIAKALAENASLRSISLDVNENLVGPLVAQRRGASSEFLRTMAISLKYNKTIKSITIGRCRDQIYPDTRVVFCELTEAIKANYTLEHLELLNSHGTSMYRNSEIDFYLKFNKAGRKRVLRASGKHRREQGMIHFLDQNQGDVTMIFHVLSEMPEAIATALCK